MDCVRQDHPDYLSKLVEGIAEVVEDDLATWINDNGGWVMNPFARLKLFSIIDDNFCIICSQGGLITHSNPEKTNFSYMECGALIFGCLFGIIILYFILRFLGYHIVSCLIWTR